ncbi:MAG: hypothetical protein Q8R02_15010 [Hyphomonadaceae bacterium]|nr:hypothetical protein [Hyphomonadaceae bacterium]
MAEAEPKKRSPLGIIIVVIVAIAVVAGVVFLLRPQAPDAGAPPEMGPDTAQLTTTASQQLRSADPPATPLPPPTLADPTVSTASAGATGPIAFDDESLSFAAAIPAGPANDPALAALRQDSEGYLATMKTNARADFDRLKKAGTKAGPWEVRVQWTYTAKARDIVSLAGVASEYNGGAHPIQHFDTHISRTNGQELQVADMLLLKRSPSPAMTIAICEALKAAKLQRIKATTIMDDPVVCIGASANAKTEDAKLALAPSNQPNKFGGVYAYYDPYAVGPYSEGTYVLTVQQEIFAEDLKPEFKALFGGEAPPAKD